MMKSERKTIGVIDMRKSAIIAFLLISSMFFALTPVSAPSTAAEKPTWHVGDSWSMGKSVDLSVYQQEIQNYLDEMGEGSSAQISGGIGYYQTIEVVDDNAKVGNETCYDLSFKGAFGANLEGDMSMSMNVEDLQMPMDLWISVVIDIWIDGHIYFTVDKLAFKKIDLVIKAEIMVNGDMSASYGGQQESGTILVEGKNIQIEFSLTFTPALDIFDFPIESGETWGVPDADTEQEMVVDSSGTLKLKMTSGGQTMQETLDLSDEEYQVDETMSIAKNSIEITAGKVESKYELGVDASGFDMGGMDMIPIDDLGLPSMPEEPSEMTLTYDPEDGFVESAGVGMGEGMEFALEPASKSEVDTFYADPSANVPGPGLSLWMILLIIGVIIAVVVVIAAVLVRRKGKKSAPADAYGQQYPQGPATGQPYGPQYPQQPGYQTPPPPPDQPYSPPPPPPPSY
jgi:hypothetical protein